MFNPFRRNPARVVAVRNAEPPEVQLRIIRTHMAAQAGEMGNMRDALSRIPNHTGTLLDILNALKGIQRHLDSHLALAEIHKHVTEGEADQ